MEELLLRGEAAFSIPYQGDSKNHIFLRPLLQKRSKMVGNFSMRVGFCVSTSLVVGRPTNVSTKLDIKLELHCSAIRVRGGSRRVVFCLRAVWMCWTRQMGSLWNRQVKLMASVFCFYEIVHLVVLAMCC